MRSRRRGKAIEELSFWQSYSDMMAALLLVFVLIIAFSISLTKSTYEEKEAELEAQNAEIVEYQKQLEDKEAEIEEQKLAFAEQQEQLDSIIGIRTSLILKLKEEFENTDMNIAVDPESGAISFDSSILFDSGRSELKASGKEFLNRFFPLYFDAILDEGMRDYVAEVIIEGHTDNNGSYLYNLDLSQKRALAVAKYCLGEDNDMFTSEKLEEVRSLVTANGRSYYELKYDENGNVDMAASRRVEIKFRLKEDEMIDEMLEVLEN